MRTVEWKGPRPPQAVLEALSASEIGLGKGPAGPAANAGMPPRPAAETSGEPAAEEAPLIVFASSGVRGGISPDRVWIWLASR